MFSAWFKKKKKTTEKKTCKLVDTSDFHKSNFVFFFVFPKIKMQNTGNLYRISTARTLCFSVVVIIY